MENLHNYFLSVDYQGQIKKIKYTCILILFLSIYKMYQEVPCYRYTFVSIPRSADHDPKQSPLIMCGSYMRNVQN